MHDPLVTTERRWAAALGGCAMLVICLIPIVLLVLARWSHPQILGAPGPGSGFRFDYGMALSNVPAIVSVALLAPLAGLKRRAVLWWLLPPAGLYYAWVIGARVAQRSTPPKPPAAAVQSPTGARRAEDLIREGLAR